MKLTGGQIKELQQAIASAFNSSSALKRMVRIELDVSLDLIAGGENLGDIIFNLIEWAESNGRIEELVAKAHGYNPGNLELKAFAEKFAQSLPAKKDVADLLFETILIPAGPFLMGSPDAADEWKQHTVSLDYDFEIGKYPVTNEQYARFVEQKPERRPKAGGWRYINPPAGKLDHPVVGISWQDAVSYCQWLSQETGRTCRLPNEAEWEKAASWDENTKREKRYPWGDEFDPGRCNSRESGINDTTAVGTYSPHGDSAYGCADMAGNVWEWTSTVWGESGLKAQFTYPYDTQDGRDNLKQDATTFRVFRGGAYNSDISELDCSSRDYYASDSQNKNLGFRVVLEG